jgi:hypothetical protein
MKIGITVNDDKKRSAKKYKVWARTSDGNLRYAFANENATIERIIEWVSEEESEVMLKKTNAESSVEHFLQEI